ncbi:hypothetical protein LBMAG57_29120 [Verrucomicrobiota bacterium]|jgi:hypothetical protein|nr:hypothetical protein LBMAG57_29120 [Verrucomicrobiota bacterium]
MPEATHLPKLKSDPAGPLTIHGLPNKVRTVFERMPHHIREFLGTCPCAGTGVHVWVFNAARRLHRFFPDKDALAQLLQFVTRDCGRTVPWSEISDAIKNSSNSRRGPYPAKQTWAPKWPERNRLLIEQIGLKGPTLADLSALSPVPLSDGTRNTETIIDALFPGNPLLCCGRSSSAFATRPREDWRGSLHARQLIVPSPMSDLTGRRKSDGRESAHTLANTGPREFLVVEFDFKESDDTGKATLDAPLLRSLAAGGVSVADLCAALHQHLAQYAPLAMVVHSGGKSLHGWFFAHGQPDATMLPFMRYAISIGADPATWTRSQFVRMPDGTRDNGKLQRVHFFNPEVLP